jgi:membrane associated rhomboid family serine protease
MIAFVFSGGMLVTVLPHDPTISWQSHLGGAIGGIAAAIAFRHADPPAPRQRYSWEDEPEEGDSSSSM